MIVHFCSLLFRVFFFETMFDTHMTLIKPKNRLKCAKLTKSNKLFETNTATTLPSLLNTQQLRHAIQNRRKMQSKQVPHLNRRYI